MIHETADTSVYGRSEVITSRHNFINLSLKMFILSVLSLQVFEALFSPPPSSVYKVVSKNDRSQRTVNIEISGGVSVCTAGFFSYHMLKISNRIRRLIVISGPAQS